MDPDVTETVFANVGEGVLVINRQRRILSMNAAGMELTGWKQRDLGSINCNVFMCRD